VALAAGAAIFWLSISMWTRDRLHAPDALAGSCVHQREIAKLRQNPTGYLAFIVTREGRGPPHLRARVAGILVHRFGFLFVTRAEQAQLVDAMRICGTAPRPSSKPRR
jgi:hypothetical protein